VSVEIRACSTLDELRDGLNVIGHYFGHPNEAEDAERFAQWLELERMHVAAEAGAVVGATGAFTFRMSVPGGDVPTAGVTVVGVLPSHRRRGILTGLMREQLDDCRRRGEPLAALWASEGTIYGRYGYGLASRTGSVSLAREHAGFALPFEPRGTVRLVELDEALETFPPLYEEMRARRPGMVARTPAWWETRRLRDDPARRQAGPLARALLELDGEPAGYALYRVKQEWSRSGFSTGAVTVLEAVAPAVEAGRELWRWILDFDWTSTFAADLLPLDHPLVLLLAEPRRLQLSVSDGIWVRLLDVGTALAARAFSGEGEVVLELTDSFIPENAGVWRVSGAGVERTGAAPDLRLDVAALGSAYLGGFGFGELVRAARAEELVPGAAGRADALFRAEAQPWCAEIF
jgi:predicted acetyltransferase